MILRALAALLLVVWPAAAQSADAQIRDEIQRLRQSLKERPIVDPRFAPNNPMAESLLQAAGEAVAAGQMYLSLEKLVQASDFVQGARTTIEKTDVLKDRLPAFEAEWTKASADLEARLQQLRAVDSNGQPAAIRALAEAARTRARPLLEGGRGFAISTKPEDGLFYMGEAEAQAQFARFCAGLHVPPAAHPVVLRSLLPELLALQEKANAAFQPPRSIDLHPRFIALNSTIKLARELDASKAYAGALYQYLEAVRHYGILFISVPDAAAQADLKRELAAVQRKEAASRNDRSIVQIFLQRAASQVAHADGSAPTDDEWKSAQVILRQVLPAYDAVRKPLPAARRTGGKTIDITLVRWPYT